ncbi:MAG: tyrosine-type recombinase/integrase [Planctomycetota bacterium]|jgi:integrase/recombinase XerD
MKNSKTKRRYSSHRGGLAPDKYLTREQVKALKAHLAAAAHKARNGKLSRAVTNRMIIDLLLNSGLRASELCNLQMRDLPDYHGKFLILVRDGKGNISRTVEINSALARRVTDFAKLYRRSAKPKSPLFVNEDGRPLRYHSVYSKIRILRHKVGIPYLKVHAMRHTFGTRLYNQTKDLLFVQDQMGHKNPVTTAIYARTDNEERRRQIELFEV